MNFFKAFLVFLSAYRHGFFLSKNTHVDGNGGYWGFYRFNHEEMAALFDIDFSYDHNKSGYAHIHGTNSRLNFGKDRKLESVEDLMVPHVWRVRNEYTKKDMK